MSIVGISRFLDQGIYTIAEAAAYSGIRSSTLNRWFLGDGKTPAIFDRPADSNHSHLSFLDFVQAVAVREIRQQFRLPSRLFRHAIQNAEARGHSHPFARKHQTRFSNEELLISFPDEGMSDLSVNHAGCLVESYQRDLDFGPDGLARRLVVFEHRFTKIIMDPTLRFGEPLLPSGYSARIIWEAIRDEGGIDEASREYGIPTEEVLAAYKFCSQRLKAAA